MEYGGFRRGGNAQGGLLVILETALAEIVALAIQRNLVGSTPTKLSDSSSDRRYHAIY